MSVDHADTYSAEIEDLSYLCVYFLLLEVRQGFIFVVALDDVEDGGEGLAPIENFSAAHIAGAEDGANLVGTIISLYLVSIYADLRGIWKSPTTRASWPIYSSSAMLISIKLFIAFQPSKPHPYLESPSTPIRIIS